MGCHTREKGKSRNSSFKSFNRGQGANAVLRPKEIRVVVIEGGVKCLVRRESSIQTPGAMQ